MCWVHVKSQLWHTIDFPNIIKNVFSLFSWFSTIPKILTVLMRYIKWQKGEDNDLKCFSWFTENNFLVNCFDEKQYKIWKLMMIWMLLSHLITLLLCPVTRVYPYLNFISFIDHCTLSSFFFIIINASFVCLMCCVNPRRNSSW